MSQPQPPKPAKLIIGLFMQEKGLLTAVYQDFTPRFGSVDMVSPWFPFDYTKYYEAEMGAPLFRRMIVFKDLISQSDLADFEVLAAAASPGAACHDSAQTLDARQVRCAGLVKDEERLAAVVDFHHVIQRIV